jgi:hypothetical protein
MVPKDIWFPSTFELLLAENKKAIEFMISNAQNPHDRHQLMRVNSPTALD